MSNEIIAAIIAAITSFIGVVVSNIIQGRALMSKMEQRFSLADASIKAEIEKHQAVTSIQISSLAEEVRRHNDFATRVPLLEERVQAMKENCHGQK